ncbi:hypothetical protein HYX17_04505 [Candidatus Woesearchaeota archaeon]|nr:hypothetical protein [Candidatus Woesearchaeota archaeon]
MTLIVALVCKDGIVMGADSQVTSMPIKRRISDKICKVCDSVLMAGAGSLAQIQKIQDSIYSIPAEIIKEGNLEKIKDFIKMQVAHPIRKSTLIHYQQLGTHPDRPEIGDNAEIILTGFNSQRPTIFHLDVNAMDTKHNDYCTIGFGLPFAQVILKEVKNINELAIEKGKILVYKAIKDAIETGAFSMDYPISIWTMINNEGKIVTNKVDEDEIRGIADTVSAISKTTIEKLFSIDK